MANIEQGVLKVEVVVEQVVAFAVAVQRSLHSAREIVRLANGIVNDLSVAASKIQAAAKVQS